MALETLFLGNLFTEVLIRNTELVQTKEEQKQQRSEYYRKNKKKWKSDKEREENNKRKGKICQKTGCNNGIVSKGLCNSHYHVALRKIKEKENRKENKICQWEGCKKGVNYSTKQLCHDHYKQTTLKEWREMIFQHLNQNKCQKCGIEDLRVLNFDHIYNDRSKESTSKNSSYWWRKYAKDPELARNRLQVLCYNCNFIKEMERKKLNFLNKSDFL